LLVDAWLSSRSLEFTEREEGEALASASIMPGGEEGKEAIAKHTGNNAPAASTAPSRGPTGA